MSNSMCNEKLVLLVYFLGGYFRYSELLFLYKKIMFKNNAKIASPKYIRNTNFSLHIYNEQ